MSAAVLAVEAVEHLHRAANTCDVGGTDLAAARATGGVVACGHEPGQRRVVPRTDVGRRGEQGGGAADVGLPQVGDQRDPVGRLVGIGQAEVGGYLLARAEADLVRADRPAEPLAEGTRDRASGLLVARDHAVQPAAHVRVGQLAAGVTPDRPREHLEPDRAVLTQEAGFEHQSFELEIPRHPPLALGGAWKFSQLAFEVVDVPPGVATSGYEHGRHQAV